MDPLDWYRRVERPPFLSDVARAVWSQTRIAIRYEGWNGPTMGTLEPLGLVIKAGAWYVVARRNQALRTYKIAQISAATVLDESFSAPAGFNLAGHWARELERFERDLHRGSATIRVAASALSRIGRLGADAAATVRASTPDRRGWRKAVIPIEGIEHAAIELLGLGPHVRVVAPRDLAARVRKLAREVAAMYG